jgi:CBS domain-containing protein
MLVDKREKYIVILLFSIVLAVSIFSVPPFVYSAQPSLPTSINGKVLHSTLEPAVGIEVNAVWTDAEETQRITTIKTLALEDAKSLGDQTLIGYYLFNQGFVRAKPNTEIQILINSFEFQKVLSSPGGIISISDAILREKNPQSSGYYNGAGQGSSGDSDTSSQSSSSTATGSQSSDSSGSKSGSDSSDSEGNGNYEGGGTKNTKKPPISELGLSASLENFNLQDLVPVSFSENSFQKEKNPYQLTSEPILPTHIYGKIVDAKGDPLSGEIITAEWQDQYGNNHSLTTKSLTKKEARFLGDENLEGYFMFNEGRIEALPNTSVTIKTQARFTSTKIGSNPGKTVEIGTIKLIGLISEKEQSYNKLNSVISSKAGSIFGQFKRSKTKIFPLFFWLAVILMMASFMRFIKKHKLRPKNFRVELSLLKDMGSLTDKPIKRLMTKKVDSISKNESLNESINLMVCEDRNTLVVTNQKESPLGTISEDDFIYKLFSEKTNMEKFDKLEVKDIMSPITSRAHPSTTVEECIRIMLKNKARKVIVSKKEKILGLISITDLLKLFNDFFSKNVIESMMVPNVGSIVKSQLSLISIDANLKDACDVIKNNKADYVLVLGREGGIATSKDIFDEFYRNPHSLEQLKIKNILKSPILSITPGNNIFEANQIMISKNFRRLPVVSNNKFTGVLDQFDILESMYRFYNEVKDKVKKGK